MRYLVLFIERNLEEKDVIRLNFVSQPDGPLIGNGLVSRSNVKDKIHHDKEVIDAAIEMIYSVDMRERLGTTLRVFCDIILEDAEPAKKKLYELKLSLLVEIG
ncbi:hypothetical protein VNO77_02375 [Canavalia gladiata]|uniref:Uncharacterized protein n=1 Tax=Canavalia gladiata TaxID=3824 RepID=A0AAN9MSV2_CANGL